MSRFDTTSLSWDIRCGDVLERLCEMPDGSVHCVVTSPPYWGLRDYGEDGQIGLEETPEQYVARMVEVFREVRRVLREDGVCWLNLGDSYATGAGKVGECPGGGAQGERWKKHHMPQTPDAKSPNASVPTFQPNRMPIPGLKPKDLVGIPWRVAFALQADGWWLRSDIIWCLSGGTKVYARTQKGEMPTTIKDLVRLDPSTVQLWNGEKWTQVLGWNESERGDPVEIELRSGERIGCTEGHLWPTQRGDVRADEIRVGDVIQSTTLPELESPYRPLHIDADVAWMLGLYLAEGSQSRGRLQFAGAAEEAAWRMEKLGEVAERFGGTVRAHDGDTVVVVDCPPLAAIVGQYIHGKSAKTKGIKVRAWRHDNEWLRALFSGYLHGDGHWDASNGRWRLGFTRNDRLADDFRTLCARLGWTLTLRPSTAEGFGETWPTYRGEVRKTRTGHHSERERCEVVAIRKSRARTFWDIGVEDEPHLFALASGVLTHNSKPNPMPESVRDRPTKAHEYVFLLTKSERYFYDADAVAEDSLHPGNRHVNGQPGSQAESLANNPKFQTRPQGVTVTGPTRNRRSVWTITTRPYPDAHFAVFPPELPEVCIKAGTSEKGCCPECGAPWERVVERTTMVVEPSPNREAAHAAGSGNGRRDTRGTMTRPPSSRTTGWQPTCNHDADPVPCTVLDPFAGAGTAGLVALRLRRSFIGIDLNPEYCDMARERIRQDAPLFNASAEATP